jgi:hypothetical protein
MGSRGLRQGFLGCMLALSGACGDSGDDAPPNPPPAGTTPGGAGTTPTAGQGQAGSTMAGRAGSIATGGGMSGGGAGSTAAGMSGGGAGTTVPAGDGAPMCPGTGTALTGACRTNANGVYALKTEVDVWWPSIGDPPVMDPGRGKITIWLKGELSGVCEDGTAGVGKMSACGADVPPFVSDVTCNAYKLVFPDSLWDSPMMPTFDTTGSTNGFTPGSVLDIAKATGLVGIIIDNKDTAPWPTAAQTADITCTVDGMPKMGEACFPDHDGDGNPGVTVDMKVGGNFRENGCGFDLTGEYPNGRPFSFRGAPPSTLDGGLAGGGEKGGRRASKFFIGLRNTLGGGGAIGADCASGMGPATADRIESRVWDCMLDPNNDNDADPATGGAALEPCMPAEAEFVDTNSPVYNVLAKDATPPASVDIPQTQKDNGLMFDRSASMGPQGFVKRLGNPGQNFTCADVRAALP